jgi:hypothetical protein
LLYSSIPSIAYEGPGSVTDPDFAEWQKQNQVFDQVAALRGKTANLTGNGEAERLAGTSVTASFFSVLGVAPDSVARSLPTSKAPGMKMWRSSATSSGHGVLLQVRTLLGSRFSWMGRRLPCLA